MIECYWKFHKFARLEDEKATRPITVSILFEHTISTDYYWFCVNKFWHLETISSSITKGIKSFWIEYSELQ